MKLKSKKYILIISLISIAILVSGCTVNINMDDSEKEVLEIESDEKLAENEELSEEATPTPPPRAPQTSIRASRVDSDTFQLEHQGGDDIDLSKLQLLVQGMSWKPICNQQEMFKPGDKLVINTYTFEFTLNGNEITTNSPTGTYESGGFRNIKLVDIPSSQLVADMDVR